MQKTKTPLQLLTVRRLSAVTQKPLSRIRHILAEHPEIQPLAQADGKPVYDREALLKLITLLEELSETAGGAGR